MTVTISTVRRSLIAVAAGTVAVAVAAAPALAGTAHLTAHASGRESFTIGGDTNHPIVIMHGAITAAGKDADYALGMSLYEPSLPSEGNKDFVKTYREKYNSDTGYYAAFGFVAGTVLEAAVKKAGSIETEKVREVLTTLKIGSVMGKHEVDPKTYMQIGVRGLVVQVQNGKREVVWPEEFKTAEPKLPIPAWDKR